MVRNRMNCLAGIVLASCMILSLIIDLFRMFNKPVVFNSGFVSTLCVFQEQVA